MTPWCWRAIPLCGQVSPMRCVWISIRTADAAARRAARLNASGPTQEFLVGEKIAFIGVGRMGSSMAARLIAAGHELAIYDPVESATARLAALGAKVAGSVAEA